MFICKDCHDPGTWGEHPFHSYGPCESCNKTGVCADCHDSTHDKPKQKTGTPRPETGQKKRKRI